MIDVNVYLFRWPFRRLPAESVEELTERLAKYQVAQAWVGSWEGVWHRDLTSVNTRLAEACRGSAAELLRPFGSIHPLLPDWLHDLDRCHRQHQMPGIRLHPAYHQYSLDAPPLAEVLAQATQRQMLVQLVAALEDERSQLPLARVAKLDWAPLEDLVNDIPGLRLILLNPFRTLSLDQAERLAAAGEVYFDIATLEGVGRVAELIQRVGVERVLFGSYFPMFYWDASRLKLVESGLPGGLLKAITHENAARLCPTRT
jgi:uncharacterized protein